MLRIFICTLSIGIGTALISLCPATAEAQRLRALVGGGAAFSPPLVRLQGAPYGGMVIQGPNLTGRILSRRRAILFGQPQGDPLQAGVSQATQQAQFAAAPRPIPAAAPTAAELAAMDDFTLVGTWRDLTYQLHQRLSRLTTGAGWQRHLVADAELLGSPGTVLSEKQLDQLQKLLARFDKVSTNPEYRKISSQPSFAANHVALNEIVARFAGLQLGEPAGEELVQTEAATDGRVEILTTPTLAEEPGASGGERSILKLR